MIFKRALRLSSNQRVGSSNLSGRALFFKDLRALGRLVFIHAWSIL